MRRSTTVFFAALAVSAVFVIPAVGLTGAIGSLTSHAVSGEPVARGGDGTEPGWGAPDALVGQRLQPVSADGEAPLQRQPGPSITNLPLTPEAEAAVRTTIGKVIAYFDNHGPITGTGTVVESDTRDMVLTAAHVLVDDGGNRASRVEFVPGLERGRAPLGMWQARDWRVLPTFGKRFHSFPDEGDIAFVVMDSSDGRHIQDFTGAQRACFNCTREGRFHAYGYPDAFDGGASLDMHCQVSGNIVADWKPYGTCMEGMQLTPGASGSALLANFDTNTGRGDAVAVFGFYLGTEDPEYSVWTDNGGSYLGDAALAVYLELQGKRLAVSTPN